MQEASFAGFIKMIFWLVIFYYALKFLAKLFLPILMKKAVQNVEKKFQQNQGFDNSFANSTNNQSQKKNQESNSNKVGEYVDFEEID